MNETIKIYTDGACLGNPGPGGFAWILLSQDRKIEHAEADKETTNNRMELSAVISALRYFDENKRSTKKYSIEIHTDSNLIVQAINQRWLESWSKKGWKKADKEPVKNRELWEMLQYFLLKYSVSFNWLKGHAGDEFNERCDTLAGDAAKGKIQNYHKSYKLVKLPELITQENLIDVQELPVENENKQEEIESGVESFTFKFDKKHNHLIIEQNDIKLFSENPKEKKGKIVISKLNFTEFTNKLNLYLEILKENE